MIWLLYSVIMLTTPDGDGPVWVETGHISTIRRAGTTCHHGSHAMVRLDSGDKICVKETPEEISTKVRAQ